MGGSTPRNTVSDPRQARFLVFRLCGEGFFGGALTRCIPSLRSGTGIWSWAEGFDSVPICTGFNLARAIGGEGLGGCRRGFSRAPNRAGRGGRAMGSAARNGVGGCPGRCWGTRRRAVSRLSRPPIIRQGRFLVFGLVGLGSCGAVLTAFLPSLRSGAGVPIPARGEGRAGVGAGLRVRCRGARVGPRCCRWRAGSGGRGSR